MFAGGIIIKQIMSSKTNNLTLTHEYMTLNSLGQTTLACLVAININSVLTTERKILCLKPVKINLEFDHTSLKI